MSNANLWSLLLGQQGLNRARSLFESLHNNPEAAFADLKFEEAHQLRNLLPTLSSHYSLELTHVNPTYFRYLNDTQREELRDKLFFMFYIFALEHKIHLTEDRKAKRVELEAKLKQCSVLLNQLRERVNPLTPKSQLNEEKDASEQCLSYIIATPLIVEHALTFTNDQYQKTKRINVDLHTGEIIQFLTNINLARFGYVWGKSMLESIFQILPEDFYLNAQAKLHINDFASVAGYVSFILYYIRFLFNFLLMLKHTAKGFWMSAAEENIELPTWEKFKTQWHQRKFSLLNDLIWGLANMASFLWLKGEGKLGYAGNLVCAGLLLMDLILSIWRYKEEKREYNDKIMAINDAQGHLKKLKIHLENELDGDADIKNRYLLLRELREINYKLAENNKLLENIQFNWKYERYQHINNIAYSASLFSGFAIMAGCLVPPHLLAPAILLTTGVVGGVLCFALTTIYAVVNYAIEIHKLSKSKELIDKKLTQLYKEFKAIRGGDEESENQRKQLFLQIKSLEAESAYTRRLISFQNLKLAKSIISNVLIPALVFIGLMFMPFGIGAAVMAASVLLIVLTNVLVNRQAPEAPKLITFNEKSYDKFKQEQTNLVVAGQGTPKKANSYGFFSGNKEETQPLLAGAEIPEVTSKLHT